jgi:thioredoxin reductase
MTIDPRSVAGKTLDITGHMEVLVVGAGPAGVAAARRAAEAGAKVTLLDENPLGFQVMAESVPQIWGQRMGLEVRNTNAMMAQVLQANPDLETLYELGVDVRMATACWGLFVNQAHLGWMPGPVAGLVVEDRTSELWSFDQAIVATGKRDMGIAFRGWYQPGVMGISAACRLATVYGALSATNCAVLGSTPETLLGVFDLLAAGVRIAAVIECAAAPVAPPDLLRRLEAAGVPLLVGQTVKAARSGPEGITGLELSDRLIPCHAILMGVGAVPVVELFHAAGADIYFNGSLGGFVPRLSERLTTSLDCVHVAGDCRGIWPAKSADPAIAQAEGAGAAEAALERLGYPTTPSQVVSAPPSGSYDLGEYRKMWVRSTVLQGASDVYVCQCEEVTAREILELDPPRYLKWRPEGNFSPDIGDTEGAAPPHPDVVKRLTRAGMGACQGRRCREQVQALLACQQELDLGRVPLAGYRAPVRPMALGVLGATREDPNLAAHWDSWFGMPRQWFHFMDVESHYTVASLATEKPHVSE